MTTREAPAGTQSVVRVAKILKSFTAERDEWRLTPLAERLGLPKSTAHRILGALEAEGFVLYDPDRQVYCLGEASASLGLRAIRGHDLRALAIPHVRDLARASGETATLEVPVDGEMAILVEQSGEHVVSASGWVGTRWPMHATSSGKAVLSRSSPALRDQLLSRTLTPYTDSTLTDRARLETEIAGASVAGFARAVDELEIGYSAVSAAVAADDGSPVAALSIGGPSSRLGPYELDRLGELVAGSATELSNRLRFGPPPEPRARP